MTQQKKDYLNRLGHILNEIEVLNEDKKSLTDEMKEKLGKDEASRIVKYAMLIQKDKLGQYVEESEAIKSLDEELG